MKKITVNLTLVIILIASSFFSTAMGQIEADEKEIAKQAKKSYNKSKKYLRKYDFIHAIPYLFEAVNLDPKTPHYSYELGKAYFETNRKAESLTYFVSAYNLDSQIDEYINFYLARALHANEKFEEAIEHYQLDLSRLDPESEEYKITQNCIAQCRSGITLIKDRKDFKITNLGEFVNTAYPEYASTFAKGYTYMIFTSRRPRKATERFTRKYHIEDISEEVYESRLDNGVWKRTRLFSKTIPVKKHSASIFLSEDGKTLFYYEDRNYGDIYISENVDGKWSKRKSVGENINTDFNEPSVFLTDGGEVLVYISDKPGGKGMKDIYYSTKGANGEWQEGISIGDHINTPFQDDAPFITSDGKYLYFSSQGHNSIGGYDIFRCEKQPDGSWSAPENLGVPINSVGDDIYYVQKENDESFFFSSDRVGGFGEKDIYRGIPYTPEKKAGPVIAGIISDDETKEPIVATVTVYDAGTGKQLKQIETSSQDGKYNIQLDQDGTYKIDVKVKQMSGSGPVSTPGSVNVVSGTIVDDVTGEYLPATVELIDPISGKVVDQIETNPETGNYFFPVTSGTNYMIRVRSAEGNYLPFYEDFSVTKAGNIEAHKYEIGLQKINELNKLVITWQFFDYNKAVIKRDYYKDLESIKTVLDQVPEIKLNIVGHTDADGSEIYNQKLSEERAKAVAQYLIDNGVSQERLNVSGVGEKYPLYDNNDPEKKKWNRRVELYIVN